MSKHSLLAGLVLVACSGATCIPHRPDGGPAAPVVFQQPPTLPEAVAAINSNADKVRQLYTESASLSTPGLPSLRAEITLERPRRFRLEGRMFGPEVDIGSNDELFWVWFKSDPEQALYFAHHEQFNGSRAQLTFPIDPHWLVDAFGLVRLDPNQSHEGPFPLGPDRYEIRSPLPRGNEMLIRSLVVDANYGWVLEQTIWDSQGKIVTSMQASRHRYYEHEAVSLPHRLKVQVPRAEMSFQIDISAYAINQLGHDPQRWQMPRLNGYSLINLAGNLPTHPNMRLTPLPSYDAPRTSYHPQYRGYSDVR